jgi:hypothetical protein
MKLFTITLSGCVVAAASVVGPSLQAQRGSKRATGAASPDDSERTHMHMKVQDSGKAYDVVG